MADDKASSNSQTPNVVLRQTSAKDVAYGSDASYRLHVALMLYEG